MRALPTLLLLSLLAALPQAPLAPTEGFVDPASEPARPTVAPAPVPVSRAVGALRQELEGVVARPRWATARWGVMVVSLDRGDTLFAHGAGELLAPASNMKLFTSAAALHYLGPQFRYNTFLLATGPIENGVLEGDLALYGTGDPTISDRFGTRLSVW
ncbi:MAG: hypothetical protein FIB01_13825, partial [Gemmatimonadetes bacterium]|nr:hypothetical protein [Gemmatimonadota bacterium]